MIVFLNEVAVNSHIYIYSDSGNNFRFHGTNFSTAVGGSMDFHTNSLSHIGFSLAIILDFNTGNS